MRLLDRDWRDMFALDTMLQREALASHHLRRRIRNDKEQAALLAELRTMVGGRPGVWDALPEAMTFYLAFSPFFTRTVDVTTQIALDDLFASECLAIDAGAFLTSASSIIWGASRSGLGTFTGGSLRA